LSERNAGGRPDHLLTDIAIDKSCRLPGTIGGAQQLTTEGALADVDRAQDEDMAHALANDVPGGVQPGGWYSGVCRVGVRHWFAQWRTVTAQVFYWRWPPTNFAGIAARFRAVFRTLPFQFEL
jgi:hypothetical protein